MLLLFSSFYIIAHRDKRPLLKLWSQILKCAESHSNKGKMCKTCCLMATIVVEIHVKCFRDNFGRNKNKVLPLLTSVIRFVIHWSSFIVVIINHSRICLSLEIRSLLAQSVILAGGKKCF